MSEVQIAKLKDAVCIFDFDQTIIDENVDEWIMQLADKEITSYSKFKSILPMESKENWVDYMNRVFAYLHTAQKTTILQLIEVVEAAPLLAGMHQLISEFLPAMTNNSDMAILSDANDLFISTILQKNNLQNKFSHVITNKVISSATEDKLLELEYCMENTVCSNCPANMCKGQKLEYLRWKMCHIDSSRFVKPILFFGDGSNDLCAATKLTPQDICLARKNFSLHKLLKLAKNKNLLHCKIVIFEDGNDIINQLNV